jgi:hypothetical protein
LVEIGDGTATVIDASNGLTALGQYRNELLSRLSVNSRTPEALLGRIKPNEVPSGIALALGFSNHTSMIREMRRVRKDKYRLLLRMIQRMMMMYDPEVTEVFTADMIFGSYMPSDREQAVEQVVQLLNSHGCSIETAVQMLIAAGLPIDDATLEVERIREQNLDDAVKMVDATGDINEGRAWLGLPPVAMPVQDPNAPADNSLFA